MTAGTEGRSPPAARAPDGAARPTRTGVAPDMWVVRQSDGSVGTGWILVPLRLFLGVTFLFAGLQKLADPQFLNDASPTSIHAQLLATVHSSPIHALTSHLLPYASAVGVLIAIGEVSIGVGVLVGLWTRLAAAAGMALSLGLFLTVSFHASPYFTGSDIVFFFAWTPVLLAGAAGAPALDTWMKAIDRQAEPSPGGVSRRAVLSKTALTGVVAAAVVVLGGLTAAIGRLAGGTTGTTAQAAGPQLGGGSGTGTTSTSTSTSTPSGGTTPTADPSGQVHRAGVERAGRGFGQLHRPEERGPVTGHPARRRRLRRLRRRLHPRGLHGGLPDVGEAHRLSLPRVRVQCQDGGGRAWARPDRTDQDQGHPGGQWQSLRAQMTARPGPWGTIRLQPLLSVAP